MSIKQMKTLTVGETTYQVVDSTVPDWAREPTKPTDFAAGGTMGGSLTINGDLTVNGTSTTVETFNENVNVEDNTITLRHNATTGLQNEDYTGIIAHNYDGTTDGMLVFDNNGTAYVGDAGDLQPLATRSLFAEDNGELVSWDAANQTLVKAPVKVENIVTKDNFDSLNTVLSTNTNNAEMSYVKDVPTDSANYAAVQKVGGMTRKCTNLIPFPYIFGGSATINGVTFTANSDGSITANGTSTEVTHLELGNVTFAPNTNYIMSGAVRGRYDLYLNNPYTPSWVPFSFDTKITTTVIIYIDANITFANEKIYPMLNEGSTALPYEPYFEGLRSAKVTEVKSVGANIANCTVNQKVSGVTFSNIDGRCVLNGTATTVFSFDLVNVWLEAGTYTLGASGLNINGVDRVYFKTVSNTIAYGNTTAKVKISEAGKYTIAIVLNTSSAYSNKDIELFLYEGSIAQPYRPYSQHALPIPEAVRNLDGYGMGVSDTVYNYIDWEKKQFVKRCASVDLGTLNWSKVDDNNTYVTSVYGMQNAKTDEERKQGWICEKYNASSVVDNTNLDNKSAIRYVSDSSFYIRDADYTDEETFNAAMSGVMLVYELVTPEVTDISDLISADNFIGVEGNGTLTFKNAYEYAVPSEVTLYEGGTEIVGSKTFVGDLIGEAGRAKKATMAVYDESGNKIDETYLPKSGGTMTGSITMPHGTSIRNNSGNPILEYRGSDSDSSGTRVGDYDDRMVLLTSGDDLWHFNHAAGGDGKILDSLNYSSYALPLSGGTINGLLRVDAPIFGYNYKNSDNTPSFIFDKASSHLTGIGSNGEVDTILFAPVYNEEYNYNWVSDYYQKWKFQGDVIARTFKGDVDASNVTAGTLGGQVVANASAVATLGTKQVRNIYAGTSDLTAGSSALPTGDIYIVYE